MLKPSDTWKWRYNETNKKLLINADKNMNFEVKLPAKLLIESAFQDNEFTVEDAMAFSKFSHEVSQLSLSDSHRADLLINSIAVKRFYRPVQPKSWFFSNQGDDFVPEEGEIVHLRNCFSEGLFMAVDIGDISSVCVSLSLRDFCLSETKVLKFGEPIKVMHDRFAKAQIESKVHSPYALVG